VSGEVRFMQGNEACAEAAIRAGLSFFAGYPITPSTEIAESLADRLPRVGGTFIQMEDEIASIAAVIGASLTGAKAMTATSGPGFSLKQENIGYAALAEVPCVVVNVQRMGPSTGLPTSPAQGDVMQARWGTHGDHPIVVLSPSSVRETYDLTIWAFNISERLRVPVILLLDEIVAHMREKIIIPEEVSIEVRPSPTTPPGEYLPYAPLPGSDIPPMAAFGDGYRYHVTGLFHSESGMPIGKGEKAEHLLRRICQKVERRRAELVRTQVENCEDAELIIFSYGATARSALRASRNLRGRGYRVGFAKTSVIWPFPAEALREIAAGAHTVLVPEMNLGQLVLEVERALLCQCQVLSYSRVDGEMITPDEIERRVLEVLS